MIKNQEIWKAKREKAVELGFIPRGGEIKLNDFEGATKRKAKAVKELRQALNELVIAGVEL